MRLKMRCQQKKLGIAPAVKNPAGDRPFSGVRKHCQGRAHVRGTAFVNNIARASLAESEIWQARENLGRHMAARNMFRHRNNPGFHLAGRDWSIYRGRAPFRKIAVEELLTRSGTYPGDFGGAILLLPQAGNEVSRSHRDIQASTRSGELPELAGVRSSI